MQPIAVMCALDWELAHLRQALPAGVDDNHVLVTQLGEQPLLLVTSGVGMANAAAATHEVIARYAPRAVVNYGCAGAHRAELLPGDLVVGTRVVAYDTDSAEVALADEELLAAARNGAAAIGEQARVVFGTVASADRWNRTREAIAALVARHDSLCEDMEAAAIGLACASHAVPFLSIKDISNNELLLPTRDWQTLLAELGVDQLARRAAAYSLAVLTGFTVSGERALGKPRFVDLNQSR